MMSLKVGLLCCDYILTKPWRLGFQFLEVCFPSWKEKGELCKGNQWANNYCIFVTWLRVSSNSFNLGSEDVLNILMVDVASKRYNLSLCQKSRIFWWTDTYTSIGYFCLLLHWSVGIGCKYCNYSKTVISMYSLNEVNYLND